MKYFFELYGFHIAPETFFNDEVTNKSNVYSFAMIMYEIITMSLLDDNKNFSFRIINIVKEKRPELSKDIPICYQNLIKKCWSQEPSQRPTFKEILALFETDKFVKNVDKELFFKYVNSIKNSMGNNDLKIRKINKCYIDTFPLNLEQFSVVKRIEDRGINEIFQVRDKKSGNLFCAKVIKDNLIICDKFQISSAIKIMLQMNYPVILKTIGYSLYDFDNNPFLVIISEFIPNGTLQEINLSFKKGMIPIEWNDTKKIISLYGIAKGMSYLHSLNIIHCDLKPSNVFLDDDFYPIIGDLDLCEIITDTSIESKNEMKGTLVYMPPEVIKGEKWTKSGDVFSFSILAYEVLTLMEPYIKEKIRTKFQLFKFVVNGGRLELNDSIPQIFKDLLIRCWSQNQSKRPTFNEIVEILKTVDISDDFDFDKEEFYDYVKRIEILKEDLNHEVFDIDWTTEKEEEIKKLLVKINPINLQLFDYKNKIEIGKGSFGRVFKVKEKKSGITYAAKVSYLDLKSCTDEDVINISREINIISKLNFQSVLKFKGFNSFDFKKRPRPTIITEFITNHSLKESLENERKGMSYPEWDDTKKLINIYGIAAGMAYLHSLNILHRDLKPDNIFLDDYLYPKIGDFGLSKQIVNKSKDSKKPSGFKGTYAYSAPEIFSDHIYIKAGDVYAFSMIVYEIITLEIPFNGVGNILFGNNIVKGLRPKFESDIAACYKELIENCWNHDPDKRPTFDQIIEDLESNPNFITETIDEAEFSNYIDSIRYKTSSNKSKNQRKTVKPLKKVSIDFSKNEELEKIEEIEEINEINEAFSIVFLDLKNFEKQKLIKKGKNSIIYKVKGINTGNIYAAKISTIIVNKQSRNELIHLSREVNIISQINHPSFLQFIGYSPTNFEEELKPVVIYELPKNGSLSHVLDEERNGHHISGWNDTIKLIIIYGIASGMAYLHSQDILHRNLTTKSVFLDKFLFPKIGNFGFLTKIHSNESITFQSTSEIKGDLEYLAPELLQYNEYSKSTDVYAFSMILFEIMTLQIPYFNKNKNSINTLNIFNNVVTHSKRPEIKVKIPGCYHQLIKDCWSQNPSDRPSFENIEYILKTNEDFIIKSVNRDAFQSFVKKIEESRIQFYSEKHFFKLDGMIKEKNRINEDKNSSSELNFEEEETYDDEHFQIINESENSDKSASEKSKKQIIKKKEQIVQKTQEKNYSKCCLLL